MADGFFSISENPSSLENILVNRPYSLLESCVYSGILDDGDYNLTGSLRPFSRMII
jgi:hypothetical protein